MSVTSTPTKRAGMIVHEQEPYNAEPPPWALTRGYRATVELALRQAEELEPAHPHLARWRTQVPRERSGSAGQPLTHDPAQG